MIFSCCELIKSEVKLLYRFILTDCTHATRDKSLKKREEYAACKVPIPKEKVSQRVPFHRFEKPV